jgi:integrase
MTGCGALLHRASAVVQVPRVVLYALRHTSATLTLAATKDLERVVAWLGHSNESMVLQRYQHLLPGSDQEAERMLGELIKRRPRREQNGSGHARHRAVRYKSPY